MEQGKTKHVIPLPIFNKKELEVCDILIDLQYLFHQSIHNYNSFPKWASKKRRSNIGASSSPSLPRHHSSEIQTQIQDKAKASSPATPLSFSPGQSDEKPNYSSKKRGREEWMGIIQELTQSGEILKAEVERVRSYHSQLQVHNNELKAWKQKILLKKEDELKNMSIRNNGQHFGMSAQPQQQYFLIDPYHQYGQLFPSSALALSSSLRQPIRPRGIPDLNVSPEEAYGLDTLQPLDRGDPKEKRLIRRIIRTKKRNEQRCR